MITCVWAWWFMSKIGLGYYDDQMLCARHWANGCWLNAWTDVSGLMTVTWFATHGYAMWAMLLMGRAWAWAKPPKMWGNTLCGLLSDGQKPHDLLRYIACDCVDVQKQLLGTYQEVPNFSNV